jgi:hypothetical protein
MGEVAVNTPVPTVKAVVKSKLVWNAFEWKKWWSMRFIIMTAVFSAVSAAYLTLPDDWLPSISTGMKQFFALGTIFTSVCAGVSRVLKQPNTTSGGS